jgi:hypothetical protein
MATDKTGTWSLGESVLWYTPTSSLDVTWSQGESYLEDEYEAPAGGLSIPIAMYHYQHNIG